IAYGPMNVASRHVRAWATLLGIMYAAIFLAGFIAPYAPNEQNRSAPFTAPTRVHFLDETGEFHLRPFVYRLVSRSDTFDEYDEDRSRTYPMRFVIHGPRYEIAGFSTDRHLFGVDEPARVFLFGTDQF